MLGDGRSRQGRWVFVTGPDRDRDLVVEDEEAVVVFATVCTPVVNRERHLMEGPFHVHLDRPLGGPIVFDGVTGREVPYKNGWDEMNAAGVLGDWRSAEPEAPAEWDPDALDGPDRRDYDDLHDVF